VAGNARHAQMVGTFALTEKEGLLAGQPWSKKIFNSPASANGNVRGFHNCALISAVDTEITYGLTATLVATVSSWRA
jgi:hypothetical protein